MGKIRGLCSRDVLNHSNRTWPISLAARFATVLGGWATSVTGAS
jgi:hypothetical protein